MVNIVVCGHGEIASGLENSVDLIAGEFKHVKFINYQPNVSEEELKNTLLTAINKQETLILTDILGGTPFKVAAAIANEKKDSLAIKVISGVNLPMLLGLVFEENSDLDNLTTLALESAKNGIKLYPTD